MGKDIDRVCASFERALRAGLGTRRSDKDLDRQARNYRRGVAPYSAIEAPVRQLLNAAGISVIQYALYYNFGRRIARLKLQYSGTTLFREAWLAVHHWNSQGLTLEIMKNICWVVFDLDLERDPADATESAQRPGGQQPGASDGHPDGTRAATVPERR
jgi:hypothetical protein